MAKNTSTTASNKAKNTSDKKADKTASKKVDTKTSTKPESAKPIGKATGKNENAAETLANHNFAIRDKERITALLAKTNGKVIVSVTDDEGNVEERKVSIQAICSAGVEGNTVDVLNGRLGNRTQIIHSILIDAARRNVVMTTKAIQEALESYLGEGHGAAYAHLNTLLGKGDNLAHPCKQTPYVIHDESVSWGWGLSLKALELAGFSKTELPSWVKLPKGDKYKPAQVKIVKVVPEKKADKSKK